MTVTIKLPSPDGGVTSTTGTRVFNHEGREITEITRIRVDWGVDECAYATIDVAVNGGTTLDNVHALLGTETLEQVAEMHGYRLVAIGDEE